MEKKHKFSIWYVLLGIWFILIFHNFLVSAFSIKTIPYSEFLTLLKENKVDEVAISANQIEGKLKGVEGDPSQEDMFRTVRVDPETSQLLDEYNVTFKGEIESRFFANLFSWLIPIFIFFGIWFFLMKRMAGQQPGFMTFGKNKAKVFMQEDIDISFEDVAGVEEAKLELMEVVEFLKEPGKFTELGGKIPRGTLLVGPPGTGKTMLAKAVAVQVDARIGHRAGFHAALGAQPAHRYTLFSQYIGDRQARENVPAGASRHHHHALLHERPPRLVPSCS